MMELLEFIDVQIDEMQDRPGLNQRDVIDLLLDLRSQVVASLERATVAA